MICSITIVVKRTTRNAVLANCGRIEPAGDTRAALRSKFQLHRTIFDGHLMQRSKSDSWVRDPMVLAHPLIGRGVQYHLTGQSMPIRELLAGRFESRQMVNGCPLPDNDRLYGIPGGGSQIEFVVRELGLPLLSPSLYTYPSIPPVQPTYCELTPPIRLVDFYRSGNVKSSVP